MRKSLTTLLLAGALAGSVGAASAAVIDFTANDATSGSVMLNTSIGWEVTASHGALSNPRHWNNTGCDQGWGFTCAGGNGSFDVGFGVRGANNNEIDTTVGRNEYVQVEFDERVQVTGFAGMLTYARNTLAGLSGSREQVILEYRLFNGTWETLGLPANPLFLVNEPGAPNRSFDTVGLAFLDGLSLFTDAVRFRAGGTLTADDGTFNVTAAGLQVTAVPLPAGGLLLLGGLAGLAALRRRKAIAA